MDMQVNALALASVYADAAATIIKSQNAIKAAHGSLWKGYTEAGRAACAAGHSSKVMKDSLRLAISASGGELSQGTYNRYSPIVSAIVDKILTNEVGAETLDLPFAECDKLVKEWRQTTKEQQRATKEQKPANEAGEQQETQEMDGRAALLSRLATITSSMDDEHLSTFVQFAELLAQMSHDDLSISLAENMGE
jgi:hypothetical protein